ncbi:hypothetical protein [Paraliomyxa miuraensis]|uniref:hypothetical protein n=1 Tax=Paraliomyxa miuraensis TaxID=376150 RepID=UPI0022507E43|nr:hypothetical protein [Paraliomyxa miuraensis]MCX4244205.1 hypothetical protein [Paraliomyxa miuraensis]
MSTKGSKKSETQELTRALVESLLHGLIADGTIVPADKTKEDLIREVLSFWLKWRKSGGDLDVKIDHRCTLLADARRKRTEGYQDLSILLYATWFEHSINALLLHRSDSVGMTEKEAISMIRETSMSAKLGWLLKLLCLPLVATHHAKLMLKVADLRNAFVHYKWRPSPDLTPSKKETARALANVEKTVAYMRRYERRVMYSGKKPKLPLSAFSHDKGRE